MRDLVERLYAEAIREYVTVAASGRYSPMTGAVQAAETAVYDGLSPDEIEQAAGWVPSWVRAANPDMRDADRLVTWLVVKLLSGGRAG